MVARYTVILMTWLCIVAVGVTHCLTVLNHTLGPGREIQAVSLACLPGHSCRVKLLNASFEFKVPVLPDDAGNEAAIWLGRYGDILGIGPLESGAER
ncbi:MAG: hypothetical protein AB1500_11590 [Bacillota bacterium]